MALTRAVSLGVIYASLYNEIVDCLNGTTGGGQPVSLTQLSSASFYALTLRNQGSGGLHLKTQTAAGATLLDHRDAYTDFDSGVLRVDHTNNRVGVNNTAPAQALDVTGNTRISGTLFAHGVGDTGLFRGIGVEADGTVGMLHSAGAKQASQGLEVSLAISTNMNMETHDASFTYAGVVATTGTATSGGNTTLTQTGAGWSVNAYAGKIVKLTGGTGSAAADPYRLIASNTSDTLTVTAAWTTNPASGTTFTVNTKGDLAGSRILSRANAGAITSIIGAEIRAERQVATGEAGTVGIQVGAHSGVATTDGSYKNIGVQILGTSASATIVPQPASPVPLDAGLLFGGDGGTMTKYIAAVNSASTEVFHVTAAGTVRAAQQIVAGSVATIGSSAPLVVAGTASTRNGGIQSHPADGASSFVAMYMTNSDFGTVETDVGGTAGSNLTIGSGTGHTALRVNGMSGQTGRIFEAAVTADPRWGVDVNGIPDWINTANFGTGSDGAAATLRNVSLSGGNNGPTVTAQSTWVKIKVNGTQKWIPAWDV